MADKSDKHGPRLDDEMKHETEGLLRGDGPTHAEEFKDPEPVDTDTGRDPTSLGTARPGAAPPGMTPRDVVERSAMAQVLAGVDYPASPRALAGCTPSTRARRTSRSPRWSSFPNGSIATSPMSPSSSTRATRTGGSDRETQWDNQDAIPSPRSRTRASRICRTARRGSSGRATRSNSRCRATTRWPSRSTAPQLTSSTSPSHSTAGSPARKA